MYIYVVIETGYPLLRSQKLLKPSSITLFIYVPKIWQISLDNIIKHKAFISDNRVITWKCKNVHTIWRSISTYTIIILNNKILILVIKKVFFSLNTFPFRPLCSHVQRIFPYFHPMTGPQPNGSPISMNHMQNAW